MTRPDAEKNFLMIHSSIFNVLFLALAGSPLRAGTNPGSIFHCNQSRYSRLLRIYGAGCVGVSHCACVCVFLSSTIRETTLLSLLLIGSYVSSTGFSRRRWRSSKLSVLIVLC